MLIIIDLTPERRGSGTVVRTCHTAGPGSIPGPGALSIL